MFRMMILSATLLLAPVPGLAGDDGDGLAMRRDFSVSEAEGRDPATIRTGAEVKAGRFYGGVRGRAQARDRIAHSAEGFAGVRPQLGELAMDLGYIQPLEGSGRMALSLRHPLGEDASLKARVDLVAGAATARTEAQAGWGEVRVGAGVTGRLDAGDAEAEFAWNVNAGRDLDGAALDLRLEGPANAEPRASLSLNMQF